MKLRRSKFLSLLSVASSPARTTKADQHLRVSDDIETMQRTNPTHAQVKMPGRVEVGCIVRGEADPFHRPALPPRQSAGAYGTRCPQGCDPSEPPLPAQRYPLACTSNIC